MEHVNVPKRRMIALLDDLQRFAISRRDERSARLAFMEELVLGDLGRFGVVRDEDDLDVLILRADEAVKEKEKTPREILLHRVHRSGRVHDANHDCIRLAADLRDGMAVDEVVSMKRKALRPQREGVGALHGFLALDARDRRPPLVEADADAFLAVAFALVELLDLHLPKMLALEVGELQVLEHHVDQLVEGDVGLVIIDAGAIAGLLAVAPLFAFTDHLSGLGIGPALTDPRRVVAVNEAVLFYAADRDLDDAVAILADDRLFRDDIGDVLPDRLMNFLTMALAVSGAAVAALAGG